MPVCFSKASKRNPFLPWTCQNDSMCLLYRGEYSKTKVTILRHLVITQTSAFCLLEASRWHRLHSSGRYFTRVWLTTRRQGFILEHSSHINYLAAKPHAYSFIFPTDKRKGKKILIKSYVYFGKVLMSIAKSLCRSYSSLHPQQQLNSAKNWAALSVDSVYSLYQSNKWKKWDSFESLPLTFVVLNSLVFLPIDRLLFISFLYSSFYSPCSHKMCPSLLSLKTLFLSSSLSADVWGLTVCCACRKLHSLMGQAHPIVSEFPSRSPAGPSPGFCSHSAATFSRAYLDVLDMPQT